METVSIAVNRSSNSTFTQQTIRESNGNPKETQNLHGKLSSTGARTCSHVSCDPTYLYLAQFYPQSLGNDAVLVPLAPERRKVII